tara:strand:+ start:106 stop:1140 length:1035 start_codon:yes stop_codon:yes gene_type:complete
MPIVAASIVAGAGIASSIMGSSAAKKQAKAEAENRRRAAAANFQMTMQKANVEEQMQMQGIFARTQAAIAQEQMNNKVAMANYKYAEHREKLAVMQKNYQSKLGGGGGAKVPMGLADELADQQMSILMQQEKALESTNQQFTKALNSFSGSAAKRNLSPYSSSVMRYKMAAYDSVDKEIIRVNTGAEIQRRAAVRNAKRRITAKARNVTKSMYLPGRKPTLYDSSQTLQASADAEIANIKTMSDLIRSNAKIAKDAETQNIATGYSAAKSAANGQMLMGITGSIAGGVGAYVNAGGNFGGSPPTNTTTLASGDTITTGGNIPEGYYTYNPVAGPSYSSPFSGGN